MLPGLARTGRKERNWEMAHRHKMQARARGGGIKAEMLNRPSYADPGGRKIKKEGQSEAETFKRGGASVGKAFGGGVKGRADRRARGGPLSNPIRPIPSSAWEQRCCYRTARS